MKTLHASVDFSSVIGKIKPMHSVNNGPGTALGNRNDRYFTEAGIPMARNHDANFSTANGGPHTVDIMAIFPDLNADENDPASYDFTLTDIYNRRTIDAGVGVFYRLGNRIENESKRYGTKPPPDPHKWARICEHIIRHMNEGWADGTYLGIEYWEIWNEPDGYPNCWEGPWELYYELYDVTSRHLKACFPHLKIGGPAVTHIGNETFLEPFFAYLTRDPENPAPMDFFSFHRYADDPHALAADSEQARALADKYGYTEAETILDEWNFVKAWNCEGLTKSHLAIPKLKGAAFTAAGMLACQNSSLDHLMYYDARMSAFWNGLFDRVTQTPLKPYYAFLYFNALYQLGCACHSETDDPNLYAAAAVSEDGKSGAVMLAYFKDHDSIDGERCEDELCRLALDFTGLSDSNGVNVTYRFVDAQNTDEVLAWETYHGVSGGHAFPLPLYTVMLAEFTCVSDAE